jgi:acetolactate synthase-1/2/3 large subunit
MNPKFKDIKANTTEQSDLPKQLFHSKPSVTFSVAEAVVKILEDMGVQYAFGVSGGAIAPVWAALHQSSIQGAALSS